MSRREHQAQHGYPHPYFEPGRRAGSPGKENWVIRCKCRLEFKAKSKSKVNRIFRKHRKDEGETDGMDD